MQHFFWNSYEVLTFSYISKGGAKVEQRWSTGAESLREGRCFRPSNFLEHRLIDLHSAPFFPINYTVVARLA